MHIIFVRHGEALNAYDDNERVLSEVGIQQVAQVAEFLSQGSVRVGQAFYSGKQRAKQTADIILNKIAPEMKANILEDLKPSSPPAILINQLGSWQTDTLLVGHLPHIQEFVEALVSQQDSKIMQAIRYVPGTTIILFTEDWVEWRIADYFEPE